MFVSGTTSLLKMEIKTLIVTITLVLTTSLGMNKAASLEDNLTLHLTPLIENGQVTKARQLSLVKYEYIPSSHAGFITVDKQNGNHLFFWHFPAENSDPQSPLFVWLNGATAISSMVGLLTENGPFRLPFYEDRTNDIERWNESWTNNFNMLYIDPMVGLGFSYTKNEHHDYRFTQDGYSKDLYEFIKQFYVMFPEYMSRELYIGGQGYSGKYVPAFAYHLHREILAKRSSIPLKGIYLGGPLFDFKTQYREDAKLYEALGLISKKQADVFRSEFDQFVEFENLTDMKTNDILSNMSIDLGKYHRRYGNYLTLEREMFDEIDIFMNNDETRDLLHIGNVTYNVFNDYLYYSYSKDIMVSTNSKLATLMDNYKVLIYNGDMDGISSSIKVDAGLMTTKWKLQKQYNDSVRTVWGPAFKPKGFYTKTGQFCRVVIRIAGYQVSRDQPEVSRDMIEQFVKYGCIQQK